MSWWQVRRVGWNRYEVRPHGSCLGSLVFGGAVLLVGAGVLVRLVPLLLGQVHAHAGPIALAVAAILLLTAATRSP